MWTTFTNLFSSIGVCLIKVSVCLFVLRFIRTTLRPIRLLLWVMIIIMSATTTALSIVVLLQCRPLEKVWRADVSGTCQSVNVQTQVSRGTSAFGTATDLICVIIPISVLWNLKVEKSTKIALAAIIALGFITAACAIAKTILVQLVSDDPTWDLIPVFLFTMFELNLGFIVACLPALSPVLIFVRNQASQVIARSSPGTRRYFQWTGLIDSDRGIATVAIDGPPKDGSENDELEHGSRTLESNEIRVERNTTVEVEYEKMVIY